MNQLAAKELKNEKVEFSHSIKTLEINLANKSQGLKSFFDGAVLPSGAVQLTPGVKILDVPLMLRTHFAFVEARPTSRSALPYLERLRTLKKEIQEVNY